VRRRTTPARAYGEITIVNNIQVGDIVFKKARGGMLSVERIDESQIGLVVEKYKGDDNDLTSGGALVIPQYRVKFGSDCQGKWYYEIDLHKILNNSSKEDT